MKDRNIHFEHIFTCFYNIKDFTKDTKNFEEFEKDIKTIRAVERELETMTYSIKDLGDEVYKISHTIDWKAIAGMRDILAHHYLVLADSIIWDIVKNKLLELEQAFKKYLNIN